jgi:integration host factor subunit beta
VHDARAENLSNSTTYVRRISKWIDFLQRNWLSRIYHWGYSAVVTLPGAARDMTKADLVEEVTQIGDLTRRDGEVVVDTVFDAVIQALQAGDKIEIRGFGSFRIRQRKPRTGRNPKTGDKVEVPAKRVPYFKPSKELRDLVNPKADGAGIKEQGSAAGDH